MNGDNTNMNGNSTKPNDDSCTNGKARTEGDNADPSAISSVTPFRAALKNVTVEPMLFPYLISTILVLLANQNLDIQKACRVNLNLSAEACDDLETNNRNSTSIAGLEIAVQKLVADMLIWQSVLQNGIPLVFVLFLGSWSDRNRLRRPCMLLPVYGELVRNVSLLVCVNFFDRLPMEAVGLLQSLPIAVTGYWTVMFMAVFSYIGDVSTEKTKTLKVGLVNATMALALPIGTAMSGILYRKLGLNGVYTIAIVLCLISIWMAHLCIHDTKQIKFQSDKERKRSYWSRIKFFFSLKHIVDAFLVTFKKGKNNRRMKVIALTVLITCIMGPIQGEKGVAYLFSRVKFNWNEVQYSVFSTFSMCISLVGTIFVIAVAIRKYGIDDALIGTVATAGKFTAQFIFAFATSETIFYLGAIVNCLQGPSIISMKSIINKIIPAEELGQVSAVTGIGENIIPIICGPLYSYVYEATVAHFPGAYFFLTAAIMIPTIFLYLWLYIQHKKELRGSYESVNTEECNKEVSNDANSTVAITGSIKS